MSLDLALVSDLIEKHGPIARVVVADVKGSTPRETGTSMFVWHSGQHGTIGGGGLEFDAAAKARATLVSGHATQKTYPLGPELSQCCGGAVTVMIDVFDDTRVNSLKGQSYFARGTGDRPLWVDQVKAAHRADQLPKLPKFQNGWFTEPIAASKSPLWIWGAGHVGRALVDVLHPLGLHDFTWVDVDKDRFPQCPTVAPLVAVNPVDLVQFSPLDARHVIVTYSHVLDLDLCHALLAHGASDIGLIGSKTKWARFRKRLSQLGHSDTEISCITCPIGDPSLGKHPQAIAVGVAAALLKSAAPHQMARDNMGRTA